MDLNERDIKKIIVLGIVLILAILTFFIIKPIIFTIIAGLILAYIFLPLYKKLDNKINISWLSSAIITVLLLVILFVPLWFFIPPMIQQIFQMFLSFQQADIGAIITALFPTSSDQFIAQVTIAFDTFVSKSASLALNYLGNFFISLPAILLHAFLLAFVFFFALKDGDKIKKFISEISPFNTTQNRALYNQFKSLTDSIVYGQIVIGILQGIIAGIALFAFGVPNALILTLFAIILGIIPVIGPGFVWIPVTFYLFASGQTVHAIGYLLFNVLVVSTIDNVLRTYVIAKRSDISAIVLFIGMIGGLFIFGIMGIIIGPLVLLYFLYFLKAYREKTLGSVFKE